MTSFRSHTDYDLENMEELQRVMGKTLTRKQSLRKRTVFLSWGRCVWPLGCTWLCRRTA